MFQTTTAIRKLYALKKRKKVIQGGTSAGKTFGILPILIDRCIRTPYLETSVVSDAVEGQTKEPVKAYVVSNDVTTAQSLDNNIIEGATI